MSKTFPFHAIVTEGATGSFPSQSSVNYGVSIVPGASTMFGFRYRADAEECAAYLNQEYAGVVLESETDSPAGIEADGIFHQNEDRFGPVYDPDREPLKVVATRESIEFTGPEGETIWLSDTDAQRLANDLLRVIDSREVRN